MGRDMTHVEQLSAFVSRVSSADLSPAAVEQLKIRVLDSLGCAIGAVGGEPVRLIRAHVEEFGGARRAPPPRRPPRSAAPPLVFEGNKGFMESIAGRFEIDWSREDLERVTRTSLKKYNAEFHSQSTLEGVLELKAEHGIRPDEIERIEIETFDVAHHIIGGGEGGGKTIVRTKEEADHSLHYMVAGAP